MEPAGFQFIWNSGTQETKTGGDVSDRGHQNAGRTAKLQDGPAPGAVALGSLAVIVVAYLALRMWYRTASGRMIIDRWRLRLPLIGRLTHLFALSQITRSLALLLGGGAAVPAFERRQQVGAVLRPREGEARPGGGRRRPRRQVTRSSAWMMRVARSPACI